MKIWWHLMWANKFVWTRFSSIMKIPCDWYAQWVVYCWTSQTITYWSFFKVIVYPCTFDVGRHLFLVLIGLTFFAKIFPLLFWNEKVMVIELQPTIGNETLCLKKVMWSSKIPKRLTELHIMKPLEYQSNFLVLHLYNNPKTRSLPQRVPKQLQWGRQRLEKLQRPYVCTVKTLHEHIIGQGCYLKVSGSILDTLLFLHLTPLSMFVQHP